MKRIRSLRTLTITVIVAAVGFGTTSTAAIGQTVTYTLSINDDGTSTYTPGDFAVYASDSTADGNFGICAFSADLSAYDTITNDTPYIIYGVAPDGKVGGIGFCTLRTPAGNTSLAGSEDLSGTFPGSLMIQHFGQTAGRVTVPTIPFQSAFEISSSASTEYSSPLLLGTGTFSDDIPSWVNSTSNFVDIFTTSNPTFDTLALGVGSGLILDTQTLTSVPEPASLKVFGLVTMVLLSRRPRGGYHAI